MPSTLVFVCSPLQKTAQLLASRPEHCCHQLRRRRENLIHPPLMTGSAHFLWEKRKKKRQKKSSRRLLLRERERERERVKTQWAAVIGRRDLGQMTESEDKLCSDWLWVTCRNDYADTLCASEWIHAASQQSCLHERGRGGRERELRKSGRGRGGRERES